MSDTSQGGPDPRSAGPPPTAGRSSRRNSALVAAGIFLSRISGLIRERALAHFLGTGFASDAFSAAFRIPNLLQNLLGEGVLSASFIPVYSRLLAEDREEEAAGVAGAIAGLLTATAGALVVIGVVFARPLTAVLVPGLAPRTFELTVTLTRIIFPGIGFLVLSAWCLGVLNSHRRFFLSYVAPVLWNGAQIALLVGFGVTVFTSFQAGGTAEIEAETNLAVVLAWGTVLGGLLQFLVQLPVVLRVARGVRPSLRTDRPGTRRVIRAFGPVVAGRGVVQLSAYVDYFLASFLAVGALAAMRYSQTLYVLPISLFGMSVAAAELPELSRMGATDRTRLLSRLDDGLARIAFFVLPTTVGFVIVGDLIVAALFRTGQFGSDETIQVWLILVGYSLGLLASTSSRLLQSALYGLGDVRTPAVIAAVRVLASFGLGLFLMLQFDRISVTPGGLELVGDLPVFSPVGNELRDPDTAESVTRLGAAGLATAAGLLSWLEFGLLRRAIRRRVGGVRLGGDHLGRTLAATAVAAAAAFGSRWLVAGLPAIPAGVVAVAVTGGTYLVVAYALGLGEVREVLSSVRRRLGG